jgi:hypothetical protein
MGPKRKEKKGEKPKTDLDGLVELLLLQARKSIEEETERDRLREQILMEAEIIARWKKKPFYVA